MLHTEGKVAVTECIARLEDLSFARSSLWFGLHDFVFLASLLILHRHSPVRRCTYMYVCVHVRFWIDVMYLDSCIKLLRNHTYIYVHIYGSI